MTEGDREGERGRERERERETEGERDIGTRDAFPLEKADVIALEQQSTLAYRNLCNYVGANPNPYERGV